MKTNISNPHRELKPRMLVDTDIIIPDTIRIQKDYRLNIRKEKNELDLSASDK